MLAAQQDVPYFNSFIVKAMTKWPWIYMSRSTVLCATHPLILVIIYAKYGKNPSRTVHAVERTQQDMLYFSIFITKLWLSDLEDIPSHAGDHLCLIWKVSIQNCRCYRVDTRANRWTGWFLYTPLTALRDNINKDTTSPWNAACRLQENLMDSIAYLSRQVVESWEIRDGVGKLAIGRQSGCWRLPCQLVFGWCGAVGDTMLVSGYLDGISRSRFVILQNTARRLQRNTKANSYRGPPRTSMGILIIFNFLLPNLTIVA